ncbi:MAG: hypothetical protein ACE5IR_28360 [bacterium]
MIDVKACTFWKDLTTQKILVTLPLEVFEELLEDQEDFDPDIGKFLKKYQSGDKTGVVSIEDLRRELSS